MKDILTDEPRIRVLVAEDAATTRAFLVAILGDDAHVEVVGQAANGLEAVDLARANKPDVVVMDVTMPVMDGFEATREIMDSAPTPIIIVSANLDVHETAVSGQALRAGAIAVLPKPEGGGSRDSEMACRQFVDTVKAMGHVKVARRPKRGKSSGARRAATRIVVVAAAKGGAAALHHLISGLPAHFAAPVLVVLRLAPGFVEGLAESLNLMSILHIKVAEDGEALVPQTVYLAPDGRHLGVVGRERIALSTEVRIDGERPSATYLFSSVAQEFGKEAATVLLTSQGMDGIAGLAAARRAGGRIIAQDKATSVTFDTAARAQAGGLIDLLLPLPAIPEALSAMVVGDPVPAGRGAR